jgi:gamma-tubulin complex component 3
MYKRVENAVSRLEAMKNSGQTVRTLAQALRSELAEHYHVIAGLNDQQGQLSVWRLNVWVDEPYFRLLGLARMADACLQAGVQGGALLSILHKQCKTGSTMDRQLCSDILVKISEPFFAMLKAWVFDGELRDPFNEFFIEESDMDQQSPETSVWEGMWLYGLLSLAARRGCADGVQLALNTGRFQLDETKTPVFIHADTARKVCTCQAWKAKHSRD